jgi:anaerobic glycerol-3-phosphate dehydrogenase
VELLRTDVAIIGGGLGACAAALAAARLGRRVILTEETHWRFRRILDRENFEAGFARSDVTVVNWPRNDYWFGPVVGVDPDESARHLESARQLSLSLLYLSWPSLQPL